MELKGCAAIVTGGSGGLGARICRALALAGVNVAVNYAASESGARTLAADLEQLGVRAFAIKAVAPVMRARGQGRIVMDCGRFGS